jgi:hypothetical protein
MRTVLRSYQVDAASGSRLVGGEMLEWSDLAHGGGVGACGNLLSSVLRTAGGVRRVLVLGPRASRLVEALPGDDAVDILVRGLPDARQLSSLSQLRAGVTVYCGGLDRFEPEAGYDLVIALDGVEVLMSPDSTGVSHVEYLRRVAKWLAPGGTLMVTVANELGFDRLFRLQVRESYDADDMWFRGATGFDDRHLYYRELRGALESANLSADGVYAAFPAADSLSLLVRQDTVADHGVGATASALMARLEGAHFSGRPSLVDAYDLVLQVFEAGLTLELSPSWLVVARPLPAAESRGAGTGPGLPALLSSEDTGRAEWQMVRSIERKNDQWVQRVRPVVGGDEMRERRVLRDFSTVESVVPEGPTLESLLRRACAMGSVSRVRVLVQRYAEWLRSPEGTRSGGAESLFFAVPANVVVTETGMTCFDSTWRWTGDLSQNALLVRGLRDFARRLLRSGAEHPWTPGISPDALAQTLVAMAGVQWSNSLVDQVARAEAELESVVQGGDAISEALAYAGNLEGGRSQFTSASGPSRGYREALATSGRLAQALYEREGQVEWLEATLRARDVRVGELEHTVAAIRGSISFKIGRFFTWPLRASISGARRFAMSVIPSGYVARAKRLVRRLVERQQETP